MVTIKMKALDRFVRARKQVKADRAMEQGIAGHQAAMKALGNATGWSKVNILGAEMSISNRTKSLGEDSPARPFMQNEKNVHIADTLRKPHTKKPLIKDIYNGN